VLQLFGGHRLRGAVFIDDIPHESIHLPAPAAEGGHEPLNTAPFSSVWNITVGTAAAAEGGAVHVESLDLSPIL
jgi:hypothetical protein